MNDIYALMVATTVLSVGGMGMLMYKSTDDTQIDDHQIDEEMYDTEEGENNTFDLGKVWNSITEVFNFADDENSDEVVDKNIKINKEYKEELHGHQEDVSDDESLEEENDYYDPPKKPRGKMRTKRNRKTNGNTKRRY